LASPLYGDLVGLPPIRIHVGEDDVRLDDARVDVWQGMLHVFPSSIGRLAAADATLTAIGEFLADRLSAESRTTTRALGSAGG
jgi:acetyl esterase/lipase